MQIIGGVRAQPLKVSYTDMRVPFKAFSFLFIKNHFIRKEILIRLEFPVFVIRLMRVK